MNIELYIGDRLCDIGNPEDLGIYLKRVFIKPSELSVKDAQKSYEISLPATAANNEIFNYTNIEEVQGKFKVYDKARLYIDGILILDGKFRMSQITRDAYIGNLGVPAPKTVKDIFGETMMNQAGKWLIPFEGVQDITTYNTGGHEKNKYGEISPCIFPLVLYGLLPKYDPTGQYYNASGNYNLIYDESVQFNKKDFPPSVNCIHMLQQLFNNAGYTLTGSAVSDERINNLYVSYKNPNDYQMLWGSSRMKVKGKWSNYLNGIISEYSYPKDGRVSAETEAIGAYLLSSTNTTINPQDIEDPGGNITIRESDGRSPKVITITIPQSGLYKIEFDVKFAVIPDTQTTTHRPPYPRIAAGKMDNPMYEIKVIRSASGSFNSAYLFDNSYYLNNLEQTEENANNIYPLAHEVNFIDPKQSKEMLCGFAWGGDTSTNKKYKNPRIENGKQHNPMAISGGNSWSYFKNDGTKDRFYSAVKSKGYTTLTNADNPSKFIVELENAPKTYTERSDDTKANGHIAQIVWLEEGEEIAIVSTSSYNNSDRYWYHHEVEFDLSITPFAYYRNWLTININNSSDAPMNWIDNPTFDEGKINLTNFLPCDVKVNDWIDNFCKTFNLVLTSKNNTDFELNIRNNSIPNTLANIIDLDQHTDIQQRQNETLRLPYLYELGFAADSNEEGYYETMKDKADPKTGIKTGEKIVNSGESGGGKFYTGSDESNKVTQTSNFSYNWFKALIDKDGNPLINVPVISDREAWAGDYKEMMNKTYYDKMQRFWYQSGTFDINLTSKDKVTASLISNEFNKIRKLILDYEDKADSIMRSFFFLLINNNKYTTVEYCLTPEEYSNLDKALIKFNGDLYYTAEVDGYDPLNKKKCRMKLIRKMI